MPVEERRRLALHRAASQSWGEEVADTLVELVTPAGHDPATRADVQGVLTAIEAMDARWDERFAAMDARWDERLTGTEHRLSASFERGLREAITAQTRALVVSLLVSVVAIAGLAFGLAA